MRRARETRRAPAGAIPLVALVGYTNVGKSSLLNRLSHASGESGAFVADQPFATLDPTLRRVYLEPGLYVRLADTVGFITDLPKELVNAFRATLEELEHADVLVHVLDASNSDWPRQRASVEAILHDLEARRQADGARLQQERRARPARRTVAAGRDRDLSANRCRTRATAWRDRGLAARRERTRVRRTRAACSARRCCVACSSSAKTLGGDPLVRTLPHAAA